VGSSFVEYRGAGFWSRNYSIELWMYLLAQEARRLKEPPEWLVAAADDWHHQATVNMMGCVSPDLDEHATTPERVALLLRLAEHALATLRKRGAVLSEDWLNSLELGGPEVRFERDLPTEVFTRVGEAFIRLLRGDVTWDAHTSPCL
jgi:hypothetical protein